jgi:hypothetical protein
LKQRLSRTRSVKASILVGVATLALAASGSTAFAASTVLMKGGKGGLRFVAPKTIGTGEELKVVNQTNPKQFGPHTFSLVTQASLPKTAKARQQCFAKGHICRAIATWHGVKGNGPVTKNPVKVGEAGWDTLGSSNSAKGDSWFTGNKAGTSYTQAVTADVSAGPTRLYFLCAIHPEMQGSINVLPAGS